MGNLEIPSPTGLSSGSLLPICQQQSLPASLFSYLFPVFFTESCLVLLDPYRFLFTDMWALAIFPLHSPRGIRLLPQVLPAATCCFLLNLSVWPHCPVKLPSGHVHLTFNLPKIDSTVLHACSSTWLLTFLKLTNTETPYVPGTVLST